MPSTFSTATMWMKSSLSMEPLILLEHLPRILVTALPAPAARWAHQEQYLTLACSSFRARFPFKNLSGLHWLLSPAFPARERPVIHAAEERMKKVVPYRRHDAASQPTALYEQYRSTVLRAPRKPLVFLPHTLSETTGPIFS